MKMFSRQERGRSRTSTPWRFEFVEHNFVGENVWAQEKKGKADFNLCAKLRGMPGWLMLHVISYIVDQPTPFRQPSA